MRSNTECARSPSVREWGKGVSKPSSLLQRAPHKHKLSAGNYEIRGRALPSPALPKGSLCLFHRGAEREHYGASAFHPRAGDEKKSTLSPSPRPPSVKRKLRGPANCYIHPIRLIAELRLLLGGRGRCSFLRIIIIRVNYGRYEQIRFLPSPPFNIYEHRNFFSSIAFINFTWSLTEDTNRFDFFLIVYL